MSSLAKPLSQLFNLSIETGTHWKKSNITPVHKKGSKHAPSNYRPISLTSVVVKTFERIIHNELSAFLSENNLLSLSQHGFRPNHSCQTQLLEALIHNPAHQSTSIHIIFLDFSKAFNTVPHERLLIKFDNLGIRGQLLNWIKAYLTERSQRVVIDGISSDCMGNSYIWGPSGINPWSPIIPGLPVYQR